MNNNNIINTNNNHDNLLPSQDQMFRVLPVFCYQIPFNQTFVNQPLNEPKLKIKSSKKEIYGKGLEFQKLKKLPHFGQPFDDLEMFIRLGRPDKQTINDLGKKYNEHFSNEIRDQILPKFGRNQSRNKTLGIWFFEDCKEHIIPWLKEIGYIN